MSNSARHPRPGRRFPDKPRFRPAVAGPLVRRHDRRARRLLRALPPGLALLGPLAILVIACAVGLTIAQEGGRRRAAVANSTPPEAAPGKKSDREPERTRISSRPVKTTAKPIPEKTASVPPAEPAPAAEPTVEAETVPTADPFDSAPALPAPKPRAKIVNTPPPADAAVRLAELTPLTKEREQIIAEIELARQDKNVDNEFDAAFKLREVERAMLRRIGTWPEAEQQPFESLRDQHVGLLKYLADQYEQDDPKSSERLWREIVFHLGKLGRAETWMGRTATTELDRLGRLVAATPEQREAWTASQTTEDDSRALREKGDIAGALASARETLAQREAVLGPDSPRRGALLNNIAMLCEETGATDEAETLYREALAIYVRSVGTEHPEWSKAALNLADLLVREYRIDEARKLQTAAMTALRANVGEGDVEYARSLHLLSQIAVAEGDYPLARDLAQRVIELLVKNPQARPIDLGAAYHQLATAERFLGRFTEAKAAAMEAVTRIDAATGETDLSRAMVRFNLAFVCIRSGNLVEADQVLGVALAIADLPANVRTAQRAKLLVCQADLREQQGQLRPAALLLDEAVQLLRDSVGTEHPDVASALNDLALLHVKLGDHVRAAETLVEAREIQRRSLTEEHPLALITLENAARLEQARNNRQQVKQLVEEAAETALEVFGEKHPEYARHLAELGRLARQIQETSLAETFLSQGSELLTTRLGAKHPEAIRAAVQLGRVYGSLQHPDRGERLLQQSLDYAAETWGREHPAYAEVLTEFARFYKDQGRFPKARETLDAASQIVLAKLGEDHPEYVHIVDELGQVYLAAQDPVAAHRYLQLAAQKYTRLMGAEHRDAVAALENLAAAYELARQPDQAKVLRKRAEELARRQLDKATAPAFEKLAEEFGTTTTR
jgi:hypothetical protein